MSDVFDFGLVVNEGPPPVELIPGFGGTSEVVRVVDDGPEWVEVLVWPGGRRVVAYSDDFESDEEAREWLTQSGR